MSRKLTESQKSGLKRLNVGESDFYDLMQAGCNGASSSKLVSVGLATKVQDKGVGTWAITSLGKEALAKGRYEVK